MNKFEWEILQPGHVIIKPDGTAPPFREHRPTSTLIWPAGQTPSKDNSILTDPYYSLRSFPDFSRKLNSLDITLDDIGWIFITHPHGDHLLYIPDKEKRQHYDHFKENTCPFKSDLRIIHLPGHHPDLKALVFRAADGLMTWIVGDAILNEEWLIAWAYYFPNGYHKEEILQTWESVATIISHADVIIPGHGKPIFVTPELVKNLLLSFPNARFSEENLNTSQILKSRLSNLQSKKQTEYIP